MYHNEDTFFCTHNMEQLLNLNDWTVNNNKRPVWGLLPGLRAHLQRLWWSPLHQRRQRQLLYLWRERCAKCQRGNIPAWRRISTLLTCGLWCGGRAGSPDWAHDRLSATGRSFGWGRRGGQASIYRVFILKTLICNRRRKLKPGFRITIMTVWVYQ